MTAFWIVLVAIIVTLVLYFCISIRNYREDLKQRSAKMGETFDRELKTTENNAEKIVALIREKLQNETEENCKKRRLFKYFLR